MLGCLDAWMLVVSLGSRYTHFDFRAILAGNLKKNFADAKVEGGPEPHHITTYDGDGAATFSSFWDRFSRTLSQLYVTPHL